jgi:hypothetical protein
MVKTMVAMVVIRDLLLNTSRKMVLLMNRAHSIGLMDMMRYHLQSNLTAKIVMKIYVLNQNNGTNIQLKDTVKSLKERKPLCLKL